MTDINEIKRELEVLTAKVAAYEAEKATKRNWPERIEAGMCFERDGITYVSTVDTMLVCVHGHEANIGNIYSRRGYFGAVEDEFRYLGHARDRIKIIEDAHEPTGAELVGALEDIRNVSNNPGRTLTTLGLTECLQSCNVMARNALDGLAK